MSHNKGLLLIITENAFKGMAQIAHYLAQNFTVSISLDYLKSLEQIFDTLLDMPDLGSPYKGEVRKFIYKKYTLIFYRYDAQYLFVLDIIDSRSNPVLKLLT
jgi:plasmid stabilization system protein ParE